jgi:hypothetical protein
MGASCRAQRGGAGLRLPPNRPGVWSQRGGACIEWGQVSDVKGCAVQSSCVTWTASKRHFMSISTRARRAPRPGRLRRAGPPQCHCRAAWRGHCRPPGGACARRCAPPLAGSAARSPPRRTGCSQARSRQRSGATRDSRAGVIRAQSRSPRWRAPRRWRPLHFGSRGAARGASARERERERERERDPFHDDDQKIREMRGGRGMDAFNGMES